MNTITTTKIYKKDTEIIKYLKDEIYKKYTIKLNTQDILNLILSSKKRDLRDLVFKNLLHRLGK